jgi:EAL domain-containing protein (putative c-di-GMP-specific phosphodiesterase class I)
MLPNPPAVLDAAERLGELATLGRAIRAKVAGAMGDLPAGSLMFINAHPADLADEELFSADAPLSKVASRIVLEITERASLDQLKDLDERIARLRKLGYRIALDDFGDGYAGLAAFGRLHPDVVKFDMSIVRNVHRDEVKRSLVAAMVTMCSEMQVAVLGEGVETRDEQAALTELGCELQQGYLYAKPAPPFTAVTF